jgi:hypothetical protein
MDANTIWATWQTLTGTISSIWGWLSWLAEDRVGTAIIGGVIAQLITLIVWFFTKPCLRLQIGSHVPLALVAATCAESPTGLATWIRVRVKNWGWRDAQSCRIYLTDVIRKGDREPILQKDALLLWASAGGDGKPFEGLTVSRGFSRFFDIAFVPSRNSDSTHATVKSHPDYPNKTFSVDHLELASPEFWIRYPDSLPPGTYTIKIAASGNNFHPRIRKIKIHFDDANTVKVSSRFTLRFV